MHLLISRWVCTKVPLEDCDDVVQNVFESLLKAGFNEDSKLETFAYTVTCRRIADYYRRQQKKGGKRQLPVEDTWEEAAITDWTLEQLVSNVKPKFRPILGLYAKGMSHSEISDIYNISYEAARLRYRYAVNKCKELL